MNQESKFTLTTFNTLSGKYEEVPVTEEVYRFYRRSRWNERHGNSMFQRNEITESRFRLINNTEDAEFIINGCPDNGAETIFFQDYEKERIRAAIEELSFKYRELIYALFFEGMSERQYSKSRGIPLMTVNNRKRVAFRLLRGKLNEFSNFL